MPKILIGPLRLTATLLETTASVLRGLAGGDGDGDDRAAAAPEPAAPRPVASAPEPKAAAEPPARKPHPAPGTRTRISNPKAARRARSREG